MANIIKAGMKLTELPVFHKGESDFLSIITSDYAYVDKTKFISKWWDTGNKVSLIVRPRRFSKTTVLSMVKHYFSDHDLHVTFAGTDILETASLDLTKTVGQVNPVLITFKDIKGETPKKLFRGLRSQMIPIYLDYADHMEEFKTLYGTAPIEGNSLDDCEDLLNRLSSFLSFVHRKTNKKFIVLVDEYDKFLADAATITEEDGSSYFDDVLEMYRTFLTSMFKDTVFIERAILTGVMPLAANSVLSAFNNAVKDSFFQDTYEDVFGFTEEEIVAIFSAKPEQHWRKAVERLDGYNSGKTVVYNPWSIINLAPDFNNTTNNWVTSGNSDWIRYGQELTPKDAEIIYQLIGDEEYTLKLNQELNYRDRKNSLDNFLTYAFYAGYLTFTNNDDNSASFMIPNEEVKDAWVANLSKLIGDYEQYIRWDKVLDTLDESERHEKDLEEKLQDMLEVCTSSWDLVDKENSYHMWVLGMLSTLVGTHKVTSNREGGEGRFDIAVTPLSSSRSLRNYVFEMKKANSSRSLEKEAKDAVQQVLDKKYYRFFNNKYDLVVVGLAGYKKSIKVSIKVVLYNELDNNGSLRPLGK